MSDTYSRCWANYRSDCDRGMSREHLLSKALFPDQTVYVSGFDWCNGEEIRIGINSLQRRFLCGKHNNDLSPADEAGVKAIEAFATGAYQGEIQGSLLERWLLKTAINLSIGHDHHIGWGMAESVPGWPSPYLLAVAFGEIPFTAKMGAYFIFPNNTYSHKPSEILITPIHRAGKIGGFLFGLRGQYIFLNIYPGHAPLPINTLAPGIFPSPFDVAEMTYRPSAITTQIDQRPLTTINIRW